MAKVKLNPAVAAMNQTTAVASSLAGMTVEAIAVNWPGQRANRMQMLGAG